MTTVNLFKRPEGVIPTRKSPDKTGKLFSVENTGPGPSITSSVFKSVIQCAAFDREGGRVVLCDNHGNIFLFNIISNKYNHVMSFGQPCTAVNSIPNKRDEFLIALVDNSIRHVNVATKRSLALMRGHQGNINHISIESQGRIAVTTGADTAMMWNLETSHRIRQLTVKEEIGILRVFFVGLSNNEDVLVTCFRDNSIFVWNMEATRCFCKMPMPVPESHVPYRIMASSYNGRYLAMAGRSRFIHLWNLETRELQQIFELPTAVKSCRQMHFVRTMALAPQDGENEGFKEQLLCVLTQDRLIRCIQLSTCEVIHEINGEKLSDGVASAVDAVKNFWCDYNSDNLAIVTLAGKIVIYSLSQGLAYDKMKAIPPPPIKIVRDTAEKERRQSALKANLEREEKENARKLASCLDRKKLRAILGEYGQFPSKYRGLIWRSVLQLPENYEAYTAISDKGMHPSYELLHEKYPIRSQKLMRVVQRCLSALAHWSPIFGEADFLPLLVFPFVKLFQNNQVYAFETIATIIVNWCGSWFEYFPNPPINYLAMAENVLAYQDRELYEHYVSYGVTTEIYCWPLMETAFSEVFTREEWLCLWDSVICHHPGFLIFCAVAYSVCARGPLLQVTEIEDFEYFFHHRNAVTPKEVLRLARQYRSQTPNDIHPGRLLPNFQPLTAKQYPVFNKYPKFIVDHQVKERERIRDEEKEYLQQRHATMELQRRTEQHAAEEENWYRHQELLLEAEEKRRGLIAEEEVRLREQRKRLAALNREMKMKELELLDSARRKYRDYHQRQRTMELQQLEDELKRKVQQRSEETDTALQEAEVRNMTLQLQKKMFENELRRDLRKDPVSLIKHEFRSVSPPNRSPESSAKKTDDVRRLRSPLLDLSRAERQAMDDQHLVDIIQSYDSTRQEGQSREVDLDRMSSHNREVEADIEDLLEKIRKARMNDGIHIPTSSGDGGQYFYDSQETSEEQTDGESAASNDLSDRWARGSENSNQSASSLMAEVRALRRRIAKRL